jgi:hypothetical protein
MQMCVNSSRRSCRYMVSSKSMRDENRVGQQADGPSWSSKKGGGSFMVPQPALSCSKGLKKKSYRSTRCIPKLRHLSHTLCSANDVSRHTTDEAQTSRRGRGCDAQMKLKAQSCPSPEARRHLARPCFHTSSIHNRVGTPSLTSHSTLQHAYAATAQRHHRPSLIRRTCGTDNTPNAQ